MSLALGADAGGNADAAAGLDGHLGALVRADACAFHVGHDAEADMLALGAQAWLFLLQKARVVDDLDRFFQGRQVVAAVVDQRCKVLVDNLIVVGKLLRRDQVAFADFDPVDAKLFCGDVE